jgi:hypothetical protein
MPRSLPLVLLLAALVSGGCGHDNTGTAGPVTPPPPSPSAVAVEYAQAAFKCGEQGAGRQYDLSLSPNRDLPRAWYVSYQLGQHCRATPPPDLQPIRVGQRDDQAAVKVIAPTESQVFPPTLLCLVRVHGHWFVDVSTSDPIRVSA